MPVDHSNVSSLSHYAKLLISQRSSSRVSERSAPYGGWLKRVIDISLAVCGLLLISPLFFLAAIAVKLADGGPVFFSHQRVGFNGKSFGCLKFRTMRTDAKERLQDYLDSDPLIREEWAATQKLKNDPRLTPIGHVLRKSSIDELPQLINIIRGDMSLVGPRPIVTEELKKYGSLASLYLSARPGLTGLWQVSGRSDTTYDQRVRLDANYLSQWSFANDTGIILKTVPALFAQRGSY
ncbi:sugar transferase [Fulvimarina sp. MAC3]|uniref:sugar transferase n=1 Tax=Fulvimarina sp. MAC3 TaxID=3148887 RepID=UPI0031FDE109